MPRLITLEAVRTYATPANAVKAVEKAYPPEHSDGLRYFLHRDENGRYFPVFVGERALAAQVHLRGFTVVA